MMIRDVGDISAEYCKKNEEMIAKVEPSQNFVLLFTRPNDKTET